MHGETSQSDCLVHLAILLIVQFAMALSRHIATVDIVANYDEQLSMQL